MCAMKSFLLKTSLLGVILVIVPCVANARGFYTGDDNRCFVDNAKYHTKEYNNTDYNDRDIFWYCGKQKTEKCATVSRWKKDITHQRYHGGQFEWNENGGLGTYWCCDGTSSKQGKFIQAPSFYTIEDTIEMLPDGGKCRWQKKISICDNTVINENEKCTKATEDCPDGYISRNGVCAKVCADGYAFESTSSNTCVRCNDATWKGIIDGVCKVCNSSQFFSERDGGCVDKTKKIKVSVYAHDQCWKCDTPSALNECLKAVSLGKTNTNSDDWKNACQYTAQRM